MIHRTETTNVLFVCMGNICRSPTAEGVLRRRAARAGLAHRLAIDSAGTHGGHAGDPPDPRAVSAAARRGYDLSAIRSRPIEQADFWRFHYILGMDNYNLQLLRRLRPEGFAGYLGRLLDFAPQVGSGEIGDPYYAEAGAFESVLDQIEAGADGLIAVLQRPVEVRAHDRQMVAASCYAPLRGAVGSRLYDSSKGCRDGRSQTDSAGADRDIQVMTGRWAQVPVRTRHTPARRQA